MAKKKNPNQLEISPEVIVRKKRPMAKAKSKLKLPEPREVREKGWMICGFDVSMSSIAGAAFGYDKALDKKVGPKFFMKRWQKDDHYFDRLRDAAKAHECVLELQSGLGLILETHEVYIAQEEPFPPHGSFTKQGASRSLKQQAEISGAFLGGLLRYGYQELWQMGNQAWRKVIADMLSENGREITTHYTKWRDPALCEIYNCKPADTGKFRSKQWAFDQFGISPVLAQMGWHEEIPDWPDIIRSSNGHLPRPENSRAKAFQPDDRYDALAIMWALTADMEGRGQISLS